MKTIHIVEEDLPNAYEKALLACWNEGSNFPTEYDHEGDPNSRDVTAMIHIKDPFKEPRIHRAFPDGLSGLEKYRSEVLYGVHNHWCDPAAGKWEYTYHERLFEYKVPSVGVFNQIKTVIEKLKDVPYTRRAQAVTWQVWNDSTIDDPACLQRLWFRVERIKCDICNGAEIKVKNNMCSCRGIGYTDVLNMTGHQRSQDAYKAAFMNYYAYTELQKMVADELGVDVGSAVFMIDSFHIYGSYFGEFEGFLKMVENREFEDRIYDTAYAIPMFIEGCDILLGEEDMPEDKKELVRQRKAYLESLF